MTDDEIVAVIRQKQAGAQIQTRLRSPSNDCLWVDVSGDKEFCWNFQTREYRVKPRYPPREFWVVVKAEEYDRRLPGIQTWYSAPHVAVIGSAYREIHVREVQDE